MAGDSLLVTHRSELGEWEMFHRPPHAGLEPYVRRLTGWWERTAFTRRREVPHAGTVLILNIGNRLRVNENGAGSQFGTFHAFFAGLHSTHVVTESQDGIGGGIQVDLTPLGGYLFTGVPAYELADRVVHLEDVLGAAGRDLEDRLEDTPSWEERFDLVEHAIIARLAVAPASSEGVAWAWNQLLTARGNTSIGVLRETLSWTPRQLIEGFRRELGLPPKQVGRVLRFERAVELLESATDVCFAGIAADCGYYDQAHFAREFRQFAGCTPLQHRARLIPDGGVLDAEPGTGIDANSYKTAVAPTG